MNIDNTRMTSPSETITLPSISRRPLRREVQIVDLETSEISITTLKPDDSELSRRRPIRKQQRQTSIVRTEKAQNEKDDLIIAGMRAEGAQDTQSQARGREERGQSFCCDSSNPSSGITSRLGSKNSLIISVDDSSSSDGCSSSDDCSSSRGLHVSASSDSQDGDEDDDLELKIKFFFQRVEKQELTSDDHSESKLLSPT